MPKPQPIPLETALTRIVRPCFDLVLPGRFASAKVEVLLLAIGAHESEFRWRDQVDRGAQVLGPATSFWQFEREGGVRGVLTHDESALYARSVCLLRGVPPIPTDVWRRMAEDDLLGCAFARLLLWTDPHPLPVIGQVQASWEYYLRNWRPGAWDRGTADERRELRERWEGEYLAAQQTVVAAHGASA